MFTPQTSTWRHATRAIAVAFLIGSLTALASNQATASPAIYPDALATKTVAHADGSIFSVRALSPEEVKARGLAPAGARISVVEPKFVTKPGTHARLATENPQRTPSFGGVGTQSVACWEGWWRMGSMQGGILDIYVQTDMDWCATNTWISQTWATCYGVDGGYPTYEYLGCTKHESYGVGWSQWHVKTVGQLCFNWIPGWGCLSNKTLSAKYGTNGYGELWKIG